MSFGPDLSLIARQGDARTILQSILEPNREVAPQYYPTLLELKDGTSSPASCCALRMSMSSATQLGHERTFQKSEVVRRTD